MSAKGRDPDRDDAKAPQAGILGNLPRSRPAVRSPRRADPHPGDERKENGSERASEASPRERPSSPAEIEALARGGLAVAGGAASLGLRIAGRAAAAVRGAVDRR